MANILITTLNARYIHSSLGLRYLYANMGELQDDTQLVEFTIDMRPIDIVEALLKYNPKVVGLGVYIWNIEQTRQVVAILKAAAPEVIVVIGGPEVSYEIENNTISDLADFIITGAADKSFYELCAQLIISNSITENPLQAFPEKVIISKPVALDDIEFPYQFYADTDIANRVLYVEASRGCPFKCEFCLSSLDKTAWQFNLDKFLAEMDTLYSRGARVFKFVDRTFNLKIDTTTRILEFFLERLDDSLFLHFELIPDHLPEKLKNLIEQFPEGSLQFEVGIQSFNPEVQENIKRKQNNEKSVANLQWLRTSSYAHLHTDLIIGLPGENIDSFAQGFNQLVNLNPHEIQVGILKRLRGTPISRHTENYNMVYNPDPPYNILSNNQINFESMQSLSRFARYWDLIANSGRFKNTLPLILDESPFQRFLQLSNWIYQETGQTHRIALAKLFILIFKGLTEELKCEADNVKEKLTKDFAESGLKGKPSFNKTSEHNSKQIIKEAANKFAETNKANKRQTRHTPGTSAPIH